MRHSEFISETDVLSFGPPFDSGPAVSCSYTPLRFSGAARAITSCAGYPSKHRLRAVHQGQHPLGRFDLRFGLDLLVAAKNFIVNALWADFARFSTMLRNQNTGIGSAQVRRATICSMLLIFGSSQVAVADIIWSGGYETGNFIEWHKPDDRNAASFWEMPHSFYGAPRPENLKVGQTYSQTGDGSWASVVTSPVRNGQYAAKFTVKNSANGTEPADCDDDGNCKRRRTELSVQKTLPDFYNGMPYMSERWMSVSHYVPSDWDSTNGTGWGPIVFQVKPRNESGLSPTISIELSNKGWLIRHRWSDLVNPSSSDIPWQQEMFYSVEYPAPDGSDSGADLRADFPNQAMSQAALADFNKGGWTDWVIHTKFDARGKSDGGSGFLTIWKRAGNGDWIKVVHIEPRIISRGGITFDRGIAYNSPASSSNPGGFGIKAGLYMSKEQVWGLPKNRVIYNDNIKVGSENATFAEMSPDASVPGSEPQESDAPPKPPIVEVQ